MKKALPVQKRNVKKYFNTFLDADFNSLGSSLGKSLTTNSMRAIPGTTGDNQFSDFYKVRIDGQLTNQSKKQKILVYLSGVS